jgi:hypothetical protein
MSCSTSLRLINLVSVRSLCSDLGSGCRSKVGGMTGRCAKLHFPLFTSYCSGATISNRCPTAEEINMSSRSKTSSFFSKPPSARARSAATDGFSAITRVFDKAWTHKGRERIFRIRQVSPNAASTLAASCGHALGVPAPKDRPGHLPDSARCPHRVALNLVPAQTRPS